LAISRLKKRKDFLNAAKGDRFHARAFSLQLARSLETVLPEAVSPHAVSSEAVSSEVVSSEAVPPEAMEPAKGDTRFGFTVTKKLGKAVIRNRIRRRLREALRLSPTLPLGPGRDYVIVAKAEALNAPFALLQDELHTACKRIGKTGPRKPKPRSGKPAASTGSA